MTYAADCLQIEGYSALFGMLGAADTLIIRLALHESVNVLVELRVKIRQRRTYNASGGGI
jgi:hypothetical protein